ncbi:hypothetical protein MuYL_4349 [Mucilaginibacter xinganensis]|uniref:Uncharacterized protein n=1 Tax=Mucilaginibacter xinganensis TaxID=1234841 RepID=A0A223P2Q2_9SPHI|nr:hypothetical protein MuYL_4349 [Mucilaginibacter xinganensis]
MAGIINGFNKAKQLFKFLNKAVNWLVLFFLNKRLFNKGSFY